MSRQDNLVVHRGGVIVISDVGARGATGLTGETGPTGATGNPGGPVTVPYVFSTTTTDSDPGNGNLRFNQATQDSTTVLRLDLIGSDATDWSAAIDTFADSSSTIKGYIRVSKTLNPALWILFSITSMASPSGYRNVTVAKVASSGPNPFNNGDAVSLMFTRNGDKGDQGIQGDFDITTNQTITGIKTFNQGKLRDKGTYVYDVKAYGAVGDGVTDDTTAVQSVITAISSTGGIVFFPPGTYIFGSALDLKATHNVILRGQGGRSAGAGDASILKWTGSTGATNFIDARSSLGLEIADLQIVTDSSAFTGRMIDLRLNTTGGAYTKLKNLYIGGNTHYSATGLDLSNTTRVFVESCAFYQLATCITGKVNNADNSNQVRIQDCGFNQSPVAIHNPGQAWIISSCCFEGSAGGVANAVDHGAGILAEGLIIEGNWTGDTTSGTQFTVAGEGITIQGNWIGATTSTGISVDESTQGLHITGNKFIGCTTAINIVVSSTHAGMRIHGNSYSSVTTKLVGIPNGTSVMGFPLVYEQAGEVETNLATNPSFDSNTTGWNNTGGVFTNNGATLTRITTDHAPLDDSSGACCQVDYTNALNQMGLWQSVASVPALTAVIFTGWIRNVSGRPVKLRLRDTTNSITGTDSSTVAVGAGWTRVRASLTTGASTASVVIAICSDTVTANGQFFVDELRFGQRGSAETQIQAQLRRALANSGIINDLTV